MREQTEGFLKTFRNLSLRQCDSLATMVPCYDSKVVFQATTQTRARKAKTDTQRVALRYGGDDSEIGERLRGETIVIKRSLNSQPSERTNGKRLT